jgi:spermidine synthase
LLICYGVGVTADAFTHDAQLKHLDIVDISKEVFDLAGSYSAPNYANPLRDPRVTCFVQDGRFFLQASPERYDIITGEPPPLKVAGTVNLYTQEFFSLMRDRLKDGGVATFWLPIYQLTTDETKAILRAFRNVFPDSSVWSTCDLEWIMMGIKGTPSPPGPASSAAFWSDTNVRSDLGRIGIETPAQMSGLFLMDGAEIDRITQGIEPLSDLYPKRLTDVHPSVDSAFEFARTYFDRSAALRRFLASSFIKEIWPNEWKKSLELSFLVRETRLISELSGSNWLAELDLYLRQTRLRTPVLTVQNSDEVRLALAENVARDSPVPPPDALPDLVAGALASRDIGSAIHLLESEKERGFPDLNDFFLLTYLYCLHGDVDSAEKLAATKAGSMKKDWFVDWLWGKLQAEFGFRPPH